MTALADFPVAQAGPAAVRDADRSGPARDQARAVRSWPLLVLAVPAAAEVWSGWVGIAQLTGFGVVPFLPGIWSSLHLDTAVTLPVGVECYAAYALRAWLSGGHAISDRTRRFARWSAICSFALGMAGQVAFHLMDQDHVTRAPWVITTLVSCLPVLVLGMGTALAHMLREDAAAGDIRDSRSAGPASERSPSRSAEDQPADQPEDQPGQDHGTRTTGRVSPPARTSEPQCPPGSAGPPSPAKDLGPPRQQDVLALRIARELATAGKPVSRRALRSHGVKGSNEGLNTLARKLNAELANDWTTAS